LVIGQGLHKQIPVKVADLNNSEEVSIVSEGLVFNEKEELKEAPVLGPKVPLKMRTFDYRKKAV